MELKTYSNRRIENVNLELSGFYGFEPGDFHQFSAGIGFGVTPFSESGSAYLSIPVALEFYLLQSFRRFSCVFELAPEIFFEDEINLRYLWESDIL